MAAMKRIAPEYGNCLLAFSKDTLCYLTFYNNDPPLEELKKQWPNDVLLENQSLIADKAVELFNEKTPFSDFYLKGTDFQIEVWEALLKVKKGTTTTYEDVAKAIGRPKAVRAVANAIGKNNLLYFVPCHRVIRKDGSIHKYRAGAHLKVKMLQAEGALGVK